MLSLVTKQALRSVVVVLLVMGHASLRADNAPVVLPDFTPVTWLPATLPLLAKASVAAEGIAVAPVGSGIHKSDTVTILTQALDGKNLRQWAVVLSINDIKPEERQLRSPAFTIYLNTGHKVDFSPNPYEGILIHVLGPFSAAKGAARAKDVWSGSLVNPQFLGLGLESTAAFFIRLDQKANSDPVLKAQHFFVSMSSNPFPADQIATGRLWVERFAITEAEEKAYAGFIPAMMNFFSIASQTPGVRDILFEVIDIPWWSLATHGGITNINFEFLNPFEELSPADWELPPATRIYAMGLRIHLNGKPALNCRLAMTAPRVPLLNCAGIVGLAAMRPDGKGPHLMIRVMAAKAAPTPPAP